MINLGTRSIQLTQESENVRLVGLDERDDINIVFVKQNVDTLALQIKDNFEEMKGFYKIKLIAQVSESEIDPAIMVP